MKRVQVLEVLIKILLKCRIAQVQLLLSDVSKIFLSISFKT